MAPIDEDEILGRAYDRRLMGRLLTYLRPYRRLVVLSIVLLTAAFLLELAQPYLVKVAIDDHVKRGDPAGLARIAFLYCGALLGTFLFRYGELYVMNLVGQKVMYDLRMQIYGHLLRQGVRYFTRNPVGRLMTRVTSDVDVLNEMFTAGVVAVIEDVLKLAGIMVILAAMDWKLALATFAVLPLLAVTATLFRTRVRHTYRLVRTAIARINTFLQENLVGMQVVQLFSHESHNMRRFERLNREHLDAHLRTIFYYAVFFPVVELLGAIAVGLIIWFGGLEVKSGALTFGCSSLSSSTRRCSSARSVTSPRSTASCRQRWPRPSASSRCSTPTRRPPRRRTPGPASAPCPAATVRGRSGARSVSSTSTSPTRATTWCSRTWTSRSPPASGLPWWARPAPGSPPS